MSKKNSTLHSTFAWLLLLKITVGGFLLAFGYWSLMLTHEVLHQRELQSMERTVDQAASQLKIQMGMYVQAMYGARALMSTPTGKTPTIQEWHAYQKGNDFARRLPGISIMHYLTKAEPSEIATLTQRIRKDVSQSPAGFPYFEITPVTPTQTAYIATHVHPESLQVPNSSTFGFDYGSEPIRRAMIETARDTGRETLSDSVLTRTTKERAFLMFVPTYKNSQVPKTISERQELFAGGVILGFRNNEFFDQIFAELLETENITTEIYDGTEVTPEKLLYRSSNNSQVLGIETADRAYVDEKIRQTIVIRQIEQFGKTWTLKFSKPHPFQGVSTNLNPIMIIGGFVLVVPGIVYGLFTWLKRGEQPANT